MFLSLIFFFKKKKHRFFNFILCQKCFHRLQCFLKKIFCPCKHKNTGLKSCRTGPNPPKSQFLFHKSLPPRDFSIMTLKMTINARKLNQCLLSQFPGILSRPKVQSRAIIFPKMAHFFYR